MSILLAAAALLLGASLVTAAYKSRISRISETGLAGVDYFEDFINGNNGTAFVESGSEGSIEGGATENRSTLVRINLQPNSSAKNLTIQESGFSLVEDGSVLTAAFDVSLRGPGGTAHSVVRIGTGAMTNPSGAKAAYFLADRSISNFWICVRQDDDGTPTNVVTTVPIELITSDFAEATFTRLKIITNNSRSVFFIDAVQVAEIAVPWDNAFPGVGFHISSDVAGAGDILEIRADYAWITYQLPIPRQQP